MQYQPRKFSDIGVQETDTEDLQIGIYSFISSKLYGDGHQIFSLNSMTVTQKFIRNCNLRLN